MSVCFGRCDGVGIYVFRIRHRDTGIHRLCEEGKVESEFYTLGCGSYVHR